ncbi:MAG: hypothetical protein ACI8XM_001345 [Haloarculaceae archaeon]|jgi:hypothetical protein
MIDRAFIQRRCQERGLSPVVGGALIIAIVILLSGLTMVMAVGLFQETAPAPSARLELQDEPGCEYTLVHKAGDRIDGNRIEIRGVENPNAVDGKNFTAGERQALDPDDDEITVVWYEQPAEQSQPDDQSYVLAEFDVNGDEDDGSCAAGVVYTATSGTVDRIGGDNGSVMSLSPTTDAQALGPATTDITGDGTDDVPFVDSSGAVKLTNASNATSTLAENTDITGNIEHSKTRLAVGTWNGSDRSVFFVDENHDQLYRVAPDTSPVEVASPGNGAQAVVGVGDVDGDGTGELVFGDASQQVRYLEPDGTTTNLDNGQAGSNNGIGTGALGDFDGDGTVSVVVVDGSNDVKITGESTADGGEGTTIVTAADAAKSPPAVADVDDDGDDEIVYVANSDGTLNYIDDVRGDNDIEDLADENGTEIDGSDETGVT